ncbi:hypothetical protein Clacol_002190 [Clathrus columnatus]|uniref:Helicase ATP-binding domain-containing protein n=1 Tax=Clathrus columnatus TaxID=1419009 RepID=A0AAV5A3D2_9AGAM|nr:hypothetical protein Clacol_002190 [Clathrus columnatus]
MDDLVSQSSYTSAKDALKTLDDTWFLPVTSSARWMDLIGDYAGKELFVIDGDALFQIVLDDQLLALGRDGDPSFQMLHAYYNLERILLQFKQRSAEFEIVFWEVNRLSTLHAGASQYKVTSRALARSLLLKHLLHLEELDLGLSISVFSDLDDPRWLDYRNDKKPMFIMTNDGGIVDKHVSDAVQETTAKRILVQRIFFFRILYSGIPIALLKGAEYRDSKVLTFIYEHRRRGIVLNRDYRLLSATAVEALEFLYMSVENLHRRPNLVHSESLPNAEQLLIQISSDMLKQAKITATSDITRPLAELQYLFIAFSLILPHLSVQDRARILDGINPQLLDILLSTFLPRLFMTASVFLNSHPSTQFKIDFDGRIFCSFLNYLTLHPQDGLLTLIGFDNHNKLAEIWNSLGSPEIDLSSFAEQYPPVISPAPLKHETFNQKEFTLLPFDNPVFQEHLGSLDLPVELIHYETNGNHSLSTSAFNGKEVLYEDIHHWHNKKTILPKRLGGSDSKENEWLRQKRNRQEQRFMARLQSHAATLLGRNLEVIVIPPVKKLKMVKERPTGPTYNKKEKAPKLSSADKMRQKIAASKAASVVNDALEWWKEQLKTPPKTPKELDRLFRNKKAEDEHVKLEMRMYRLHLEFLSWIDEPNADSDTVREKYTVAIMRQVKEICEGQYMTPKLSKSLKSVLKTLGLDRYSNTLLDKFQCNPNAAPPNFKFKKLLSSDDSIVYGYMGITESPIRWQLRLFGEYFDRSMDSAPDPRVPTFIPDAWQRQVLDSIDANNSLLVVAPTSAGKTFISFYAMEKVLRRSDDGILVYIAPTKALVTQVAAEINARFKKDVPEGHVWAIHTRDHRIHDSSKCQILVTVPDVLTILLLSPPLARIWVPRIKWIILDEIHSIGQDGGAIWEQIILLAPAPIIGLSATIGSPEKFNSWLESVQTVHGYKHQFIYYPHRYSHLRKFYYDLSEESATDTDTTALTNFKGFSKHQDTGLTRFLHPISLLSFGPQVLPDDLALEARDTLTLYDSLAKLTPSLEGLEALSPDVYFQSNPTILRQKDVLGYERELKNYVKRLLSVPNVHDPSSPISRVIRDLEDPKIACLDAEQRLERLNPPPLQALHGKLPSFLADLHKQDKLPAILFNFDRSECEMMARTLLKTLREGEKSWRETDERWQNKIKAWEAWKIKEEKRLSVRSKGVNLKAEREEEQHLGSEQSWERWFNPNDPSPDFSFANTHKEFTLSMLDENIQSEGLVRFGKVPLWALSALRRGIGIHHAGMNKGYRSLVETSGFLRVIIATGTLALGINAPAKTSVFCGDSPFLTALMYRQCAGRAGRRGYDLLGNVYFYGISFDRVQRLVLSKLPPLGGSFPMTLTFTLRLFNLLEGSHYSDFAKQAIQSIMSLPHISFISDLGKEQLLHHLRFSIEYLRRGCLINDKGRPMNLFAIGAHLYYTEPSNFALITLIQNGVLHEIARKPLAEAKKEFILLMSHLFGRRYLSKAFINQDSRREFIKKSPSVVVLPDLPQHVYNLLNKQNGRTLDIFTGYASIYSTRHADELGCDTRLPLSNINFASSQTFDTPFTYHLRETGINVSVRSSFVATSGLDDQFRSVTELIATARSGLHLNEQTVPSFTPITSTSAGSSEHCLNAYLFDFYIHGQQNALIDANGIRRGDLWHLLEDFTLTLKTVQLALGQLLNRSKSAESADGFEDPQLSVDPAEVEDSDTDEGDGEGPNSKPTCISNESDRAVYEMVSEATAEFDANFKKMWA